MIRTRSFRLAVLMIGTLVFAVADALIKGHHGGTRNAVGDISATWALLPLLAGALCAPRRVVRTGAVVGASSTALALATYALVRGGLASGAGGHHAAATAALTNRWLLLGVAGGAVLGVVGAGLAARSRWDIVAVSAASLLVMEPVARILWGLSRDEGARTLLPSPAVWAVEVGCGCVLVCAFYLVRTTLSHRG